MLELKLRDEYAEKQILVIFLSSHLDLLSQA